MTAWSIKKIREILSQVYIKIIDMFKWIKLIKWIKKHRKEGKCSFDVITNSDTFIITVSGCENTRESWDKNMLRIKY